MGMMPGYLTVDLWIENTIYVPVPETESIW